MFGPGVCVKVCVVLRFVKKCTLKSHDASAKPTLWEETLLLGAGPTGERSGPPPRLAVAGRGRRSNGHGPMLPISDVTYVKPMLLPHGGWPMAAGPASRLCSFEPGDKTGLRLYNCNHTLHLARPPC